MAVAGAIAGLTASGTFDLAKSLIKRMVLNNGRYSKKLVTESLAAKITYGKINKKNYIVVHETDNERSGADADAHARLQMNGNSRQASWNWQVDDKEAVQSFEHIWACWAAGSDKGNKEGIQVETCVNNDGNYLKAVQNTAELVAKIMKDEGIPISNVVQHNHFSGKTALVRCVQEKLVGHNLLQWLKQQVVLYNNLILLQITINIVF